MGLIHTDATTLTKVQGSAVGICATINNEQPNIHKSELDSILNKIQDITYYKDFCFQNTQFYHLFFMTEHQLYRSGLIIRNGTAPKTDIIYEPGTIQY